MACSTPSAPLAKVTTPTATSSTSIRSWASVAGVGEHLDRAARGWPPAGRRCARPGSSARRRRRAPRCRASRRSRSSSARATSRSRRCRWSAGRARRAAIASTDDLGGRVEPVLGDDRDQSCPPRRWAAMISSVFSTVTSAGFSMITCLPASSASIATSPWRPVGVQTVTTSTSSAASASASEAYGRPPHSAASCSARSAVEVDHRDQLEPVRRARRPPARGACR